jgi:hypothetical protein
VDVDTNKSIEQIHDLPTESPSFGSGLVDSALRFVKKPLRELKPSEIRLLISQQIGLTSLVPIAVHLLEENPLLETEYYPGDLLRAVVTIERAFWASNEELHRKVLSVLESILEPPQEIISDIERFKSAPP